MHQFHCHWSIYLANEYNCNIINLFKVVLLFVSADD